MFDRNQLVHAVVWPNGRKASLSLIDTNGGIQSTFTVREPLRGSDLAKMVPDGYRVHCDDCHIVTMSGDVVVGTRAAFDTAVVTERAELTFEERMQRLERREARREKKQRQQEKYFREQNAELERQLEEQRKQLQEQQPQEQQSPQEAPQDVVEPQGEPDMQEGSQDA